MITALLLLLIALSHSSPCDAWNANLAASNVIKRDEFVKRAIISATTATAAPAIAADSGSVDRVCGNNILPEQTIPGAYYVKCFDQTTRNVDLDDGQTIIISQGSTSAGLGGRTGVGLWNSSILLTRLLTTLCAGGKPLIPTKLNSDINVIELGCGVGLPSLALSKYVNAVVATDGNAEVLQLTKQNVQNNKASNVDVDSLKWGEMVDDSYDGRFDLAIGSDLTYNSASWPLLADTLKNVLSSNGRFLYLITGHEGFNLESELNGFVTFLEGGGGLRVNGGLGRSLTERMQELVGAEERAALRDGGVKVVVIDKV